MRTPKFTDADKFCRPYADASECQKEGYLRRKFQRIAAEQREAAERERAQAEAITVEQAVKVHVLKGAK